MKIQGLHRFCLQNRHVPIGLWSNEKDLTTMRDHPGFSKIRLTTKFRRR
jgi:hypothetical protein